MIISIDWIKEFVNIPEMSDKDLSERFTLGTCEVEDVIKTGELLSKVLVVEITAIEKHPEADKLNLVTFKVSENETRQVVCGAPNVAVGIKVPYAPLGTSFPDGFTLVPKKIRGVVSEGMLCGEDEIGLGSDTSGLMVFPADAPIGTPVGEYLGIKRNTLLDIDNKSLTHRPDLWGHYGMAREFSAVFGVPLCKLYSEEWAERLKKNFTNDASPIVPQVADDCACLGYYGISVDNVEVKESPQWMKDRLNDCGLRPINNIVDISNYVMLELGVPLHIFDREMIKDEKIIIRTAGEDQKFMTLDEIDRDLLAKDTVVCDSEKPLVIAGIMGGLESGVTEKTSKIFIETANWVDSEVRKTSSRLGLRTDSSQRYEKCLDTELLERTCLRTLELVLKLCPEAKVIGKLEKDGVQKKETLVIDMKASHINNVLGTELSVERITEILESLEFHVTASGDDLKITVPSYRSTKDMEYDVDVIEEVGRIIGFDNITPVSPKTEITAVRLSQAKQLQRKIQDFMVFHGRSLEIMTSPLIGSKLLKNAEWHENNDELVLVNAMSRDRERMRPSMIPSALEAVALNQKNYSRFSFFEYGRAYKEDEKNFSDERTQVIMAWYDKKESRFMEALNTFENMMAFTNVPAQEAKPNPKFPNPLFAADWRGLHPSERVDFKIQGKPAASIFTVHPIVLRNFKIKGNLVLAVLDVTDFEERAMKDKTKYEPLAKYPSSTFDCTVLASPKTPVADVVSAAKKLKVKELQSVKVVDVFSLNEDQKTVTIRAVFGDKEKTLEGDFIREAEDKLVAALDAAGFPLKR